MLRIKSLKLVNFGPYYGEHILLIPEDNGVSIIWGNNGYGKTSIMNSFRYVLWGKIYNRKRHTVSPHEFVNTNAISESANMLVELQMIYDDDNYVITRGLKRVSGSGDVIGDYENIFHIKKNGTIVSPQEKDLLLESILPDKISRFYLFDGELLGEYEDLLDDTDESGAKIKRSIEDILGLPILESTRDNLSVILDKLNIEISKITAADERTATLSKSISESQEHLNHLNESKAQLLKDRDKLQEDEINIQELMNNNTRFSSLLSDKKNLEKQNSYDNNRLTNLLDKSRTLIDDSWRYIINDVIEEARSAISPEISKLEQKIGQDDYAKAIIDYIENALNDNDTSCPICKQEITYGIKLEIINQIKQLASSEVLENERHQLRKLKSHYEFLNNSSIEDYSKILLQYLENIEDIQANIDIRNNQIINIQSDLSSIGCDISEEEVSNLPKQYKTILEKKELNKTAINENQRDIDTTKAAIEKYNKQISKLVTSQQAQLIIARREYTEKVFRLFEKSIDRFRTELKISVQKDASDLFVKISHDKNYKRLIINDNYGLKIIGNDGSVVPNRSSGYEQVVAICLISALHKNAPIEGPIFMDSTFQRVDDIHKLNILDMLPELGSQVIVLAYDGEIGEKHIIRERLGTHLLKEYELQHTTSSKTSIDTKFE